MPSAIFRIFAVGGQNTTTEGDPFIDVGYYSAGNVGASTYANEPINVIAAPRSNGYPASRWAALKTSQASITAELYTETFDFLILDGQITAVKVIGPPAARVYQATIEVRRASSLAGGAAWANLNKYHVTREAEDDSLIDDIKNQRGRKLAKRAAEWVWSKL